MLGKLSLRQSISLPVLTMSLGLTILGFMLVNHYRERLIEAHGMKKSVVMIQLVSRLIHEIQKERAASVLFLNGAYSAAELQAQRDLADKEKLSIQQNSENLPDPAMARGMKLAMDAHAAVRTMVDERSGSAGDVARKVGDLVDQWIQIQVASANAYHLDGLESTLLSIAIFEKSKESMGRLRAMMNLILSADQPVNSSAVSLLATYKAGVISNLESPGLSISAESRGDIAKLLAGKDWEYVQGSYDLVIDKADTGHFGRNAKQFSGIITQVIDGIRNVINPEIALTSQKIEEAENHALRSFILCAGGVGLITMLSILIAFYVVRQVNAALSRIAGLLSHGADALTKIAAQVALTSQKLATSVTEQASALQETAAAVEEAKSMISRNAENSRKSADLSRVNGQTAVQGQGFVKEVAHSIQGIAQTNGQLMEQSEISNRDLGDIVRVIHQIEGKTQVINDIVFQTKLLSFNASVEAARAGEQGKGFAVVAEEVGNLARLSGSSAREIQTLLDTSVKQVEQIVDNTRQRVENLFSASKFQIDKAIAAVERSGKILEQIVADASQVGIMTGEISRACQEQSEGISEINRAMSELDDVAHHNSSVCEQASTSAEDLRQHAGKMLSMVQQLQTLIHGSKKVESEPQPPRTSEQTFTDEGMDQAA